MNTVYDSVADEFKPIKAEDVGEYSLCGRNFKAPLDGMRLELIEGEPVVNDNVKTNGDLYRQETFIKGEINLENVDIEENSGTEVDETDIHMEDIKPKISIKSESDVCDINISNFHDSQTLTNTDIDRCNYEANKSVHCVKDEEITTDENYLKKEETAESKFYCVEI